MKDGYKHLGEYIRQVDIRNTDGKEENLLGVSVQKAIYSFYCKHGRHRFY